MGSLLREAAAQGEINENHYIYTYSMKVEMNFDNEGMILIALLSGGDYDPGALTSFGIEITSEAA